MLSIELLNQRVLDLSQDLAGAIHQGRAGTRLGLRRAARLPVLAAIRTALNWPVILLTDRSDRALVLMDELGFWAPNAPRLLFPEPTPLFYENAPWGAATRHDRLLVLTTLAAYHIPGSSIGTSPPIIIAPVRAVMTRTVPRRDFLSYTRSLKPAANGSTTTLFRPEDLSRTWVSLGYESVSTVVAQGQFSRRGGILDIWPPAETHPTRIEFFGDEIETLRHFDPASQRTVQPVEQLLITPARELIIPPAPEQSQMQLMRESLLKGPDSSLSEFHIPLYHTSPASLLDYLPRQALVLVDDYQTLRDTVQEVEEQSMGLRKDYIAEGAIPPEFPLPYLTWDELQDSLSSRQMVDLGSTGELEDGTIKSIGSPDTNLAGHFSPGPRFAGRLKPILDHLGQVVAKDEPVFLVSRQSARLVELWTEQFRSSSAAMSPLFLEGSLAEGFTLTTPDGGACHLLTDGELFGWRRPEPRQRHRPTAEAPESVYADLQTGDWIVHIDHGIGRFLGLVRRTVEGIDREYLAIEYAEGDQLYVPVYQADRLTRYVGADSRMPSATRLGGMEWRNTKANVKEAVQQVAEELLELYARRSIVQGYSFERDTPWQQELEASFPYVETTDQLRVLREVKGDMESPRPMDRLICGDVGYGKTEVALRAAFKAVLEGKQVAILVPTTVLAQQHYHTFLERLAAFPVEVEMLSRFRTPHQQRDILSRLAQGKVDILIGTHRLIQDDVLFKDLGLLVIDEEQRFGVTHKETLKKLRTEVDVLTLTATPIPRTLYMALTGVRDISTINTPPEERLPIITHVGPYSPRLVRQAVLRELERGGQIFFVHNRVQTIGAMNIHLHKLVPEARVGIAHGQMPEDELSKVMDRFTAGEMDILLSTSIIESGLDIPNANTLIVDRADTFGLAQLYQLRGRVGRGAQRAFAYFFRHSRKPPTLDGRERLETIAENTQLGAGFSIAMRDLEIRGAGELLGTRQSGHIAAVGFHLYTRLLADAVRRLRVNGDEGTQRGTLQIAVLEAPLALPVNVDLPIPIGLPVDYIADQDARLRLYRRLADVRSLEEIDALMEEFADRFGPPPEETRNLLLQLKVKLLAEKAGLTSISGEGGQVVLRFPTLPEGISSRPLPDLGSDVRRGKNSLWLMQANQSNWLDRLVEVLTDLTRQMPASIAS